VVTINHVYYCYFFIVISIFIHLWNAMLTMVGGVRGR
jgi:hypothetical protein